ALNGTRACASRHWSVGLSVAPSAWQHGSAMASYLHRRHTRRWLMRFIRTRQVLEMIGVGRTTLWKMVPAGAFPPPVRITERSSGYLLDAVEEWMRLRAQGLPWHGAPNPPQRPRTNRRRLALAQLPETSRGALR